MVKYYRIKYADGSYYATAVSNFESSKLGVRRSECDDFYYKPDAEALVRVNRKYGRRCKVVSFTVSE